jgi:hypothetical protein
MLELGISVIPYWDSIDRTRELVRAADHNGLPLVGIQDRPYQSRFIDTLALVATLLAETERVSLFTDVANLPLRPPAVMAKTAASLDVLSAAASSSASGPAPTTTRSPGWAARTTPRRSRSTRWRRRST